MARTKQTARKSTGWNSFIVSSELFEKKRKQVRDERQEHKKSKHNRYDFSTSVSTECFHDLVIKTVHSNHETDYKQEDYTTLQSLLKSKICKAPCPMPTINYPLLCSEGVGGSILDGVDDNDNCKTITYKKCDEKSKFALEILDEFIREQDEFNSIITHFEIYDDETSDDDSHDDEESLQNFTLEFRKNGKMCLYKKDEKDGHGFEILILLINRYEYLYFGSVVGSKAFCRMPGWNLEETHSSRRGKLSERVLDENNQKSYDPIPLRKILKDGKSFFETILQNYNAIC